MNRRAPTDVLNGLLKALTDGELKFIAERDYGVDADVHLAELRKLVSSQSGQLVEGQYWYPYEVIELGSHRLVPGHEREFAACTLLVLRAVRDGFDTATSLMDKFEDHVATYRTLPAPLSSTILQAYESAGFPVAKRLP